ncbi:MAG: transposase, partial [Candidatus Berkelbacteria bacterium Licking1014_96]
KTKKFNCPLIAYAILNNHYHLILDIRDNILPKLMREINGASSRFINDADAVHKRKIWWNYFDKYLRDEKDFFMHLNYIHQNPVKHGLSDDLDCQFSSYKSWVAKKGQDYVDDCFSKYPVADFLAYKDDF